MKSIPSKVGLPADAADACEVLLSSLSVRRPREFGACWYMGLENLIDPEQYPEKVVSLDFLKSRWFSERQVWKNRARV